jgi:glycosyltransferase involved in cell wall biosynthesis
VIERTMPHRIMHISTRLILGGSQENTVLSCEGQAEAGHAVSLVYGPIYGPEGSLLERARAHGGIETIETPRLVRELAPIKDARCRRDLRRLIRDWRPDVVHTHSSKAGILGRIAAWRERVPCVVHTIHGLAFHRYLPKWRNAIYIAAERHAARHCHTIVCVADAMRDQALAAGIGRPEQYVTVYSGMEVDRFLHPAESRETLRAEFGLAPDDFVIGTVSRLAELKGHDDLLDALGPMMRGDRSVKLLWVGDGWWRDRLLGRVESMGLADQVHTTGLVPPDRIPGCMQAMDLVVHPSYREGLPRAVTQALLSARPAIAYDVDGTREVCIDGETGRLLAPGDRDALAEAARWMREHPEERAEMGRRGRALCERRFAAETMVASLGEVYDAQLGGG